MAKSMIIKELANSEIDTVTALKRLKILLFNLDKTELNDWVNCELNGYKDIKTIPPYRRFRGSLIANFVIGNSVHLAKYTNTPITTANLPNNIRDAIEEVVFYESIAAINSMKGQELGKIIPPEFYGYLTKGTNISSIISARVNINNYAPVEVIAAVENRVLEILVLLEKEFGNLDDLDINYDLKTKQELQKVCDQIINIIYVDKSISIGDDNKIAKTDICS